MPSVSVENLNHRFALPDNLTFRELDNGFIFADIENNSASATVFIHGAHITSYVPKGEEPIIFLSSQSLFEPGKAIRGGIPISWPWFADHPTDKTKPAHGFARTSQWEVRGARHLSADETQITLGLVDNKETRNLWDYSFDLEIAISVGKELNAELTMTNTDNEEYEITSAFHTYYHVSDVNNVRIHGLDNTSYIDKVDQFSKKIQDGPVIIAGETDRIYLDTKKDCVIDDANLNRKIQIRKTGSNSTVVWNPWRSKAREMKDLGNEDYTKFVCVEATNAGTDIRTLAPGGKHLLGLNISIKNHEIK